MKKVLLSLLLFMSISVMAQEELSFSKVIKADSASNKESLFVTMRSFLATYYKDSKRVIEMEDKDAGLIIGKATSIFNAHSLFLSAYDGFLDYNVKIQTKDGRVKVEVNHFFHHNIPGHQSAANLGVLTTSEVYATSGIQKKYHNKVWEMLKVQAENVSNNIFIEVEQALKNVTPNKLNDDNW